MTTAPVIAGRGLGWLRGDGRWLWGRGCVSTSATQAARLPLGRRYGVAGPGKGETGRLLG